MKRLFIIAVLLLAGCSAEAFEESREAKVLSSLTDDYSQKNVFQQNPDFLLSKCYDLSGENRVLCLNMYIQTMHEQGMNDEIPDDLCQKIGMATCEQAVWQ